MTRSFYSGRRMDQKQKAVQEVEQAFTDNPYYSKYADKIKKLSVDEMRVSSNDNYSRHGTGNAYHYVKFAG